MHEKYVVMNMVDLIIFSWDEWYFYVGNAMCYFLFYNNIGVLLAAEHVVSHLKEMSKQVTTPEEIAQVC